MTCFFFRSHFLLSFAFFTALLLLQHLASSFCLFTIFSFSLITFCMRSQKYLIQVYKLKKIENHFNDSIKTDCNVMQYKRLFKELNSGLIKVFVSFKTQVGIINEWLFLSVQGEVRFFCLFILQKPGLNSC